jgi:hypothetical protein
MKRLQVVALSILMSVCGLSAQQDSKTVVQSNTVGGSGTTNYIPVWTGSATQGNSIMYQTDSRIGVNTTSPQYALDVNGHINANNGYMIGDILVLSEPGGTGSGGNLALGGYSLSSNTSGKGNTAIGQDALLSNTSGSNNTATGAGALAYVSAGSDNTADGNGALYSNTGSNNTATGYQALFYAAGGDGNVADGYDALLNNTTGSYNTAFGYEALLNNTTGADNIAIGPLAADDVAPGANYNIEIGSSGYSTDNATIRIGTAGTQTSFFVAGVRGVATGDNNAVPVVIDSNGQLGTISSSRRFKTDIQDMGDASSGLMRLRPVTFRYKKPFADGSQPVQYGLIAEEVAEVYPDLVARSADGEIESVKYQVLDSMLLNELQRQQDKLQREEAEIRGLQEQLNEMKAAVAAIGHWRQALPAQTTTSQTSTIKGEQQ